MFNIFLLISLVLFFTLGVGLFLEKIHIPFIFASLLMGMILAVNNPFIKITSSDTFLFLAHLGMYFLLFMVGFELDFQSLKERSKFIVKSAFLIIFMEGLVGAIVIYWLFNYSLSLSFLVSLSFATVGEAVLVPILDEFKLINTKLGQTIVGIGSLDDIIEILVFVVAVLFIGLAGKESAFLAVASVSLLLILFAIFIEVGGEGKRFKLGNVESTFLFIMAVLFLFLGIGEFAEAAALAAILSGVAVRTLVPSKRLELVTQEVRTITYALVAPFFFLWVGESVDFRQILTYPLLVIVVVVVSGGVKILASFLFTQKELGKQFLLLGVGLTVRFSTSIVIIKLLYENAVIDSKLYSVIVASSAVFIFLTPLVFSKLVQKASD